MDLQSASSLQGAKSLQTPLPLGNLSQVMSWQALGYLKSLHWSLQLLSLLHLKKGLVMQLPSLEPGSVTGISQVFPHS